MSKNCPPCTEEECAAHKDGHCIALVNNDFGAMKCPFFKTKKQNAKERAYCEERLANIGYGKEED